MKTTGEAMAVATTIQAETKARTTRDANPNTKTWAEWCRFLMLNDPQLESMVLAARSLVLDMRDGARARWLTLLGSSGAGKTYLARRIHQWAQSHFRVSTDDATGDIRYPATWIHWPETVKCLLNGGYRALEESVSDHLVVVDEIGAARDTTGFLNDQLANYLCRRVNRWTVITSNRTMKEITEIDVRLASRMIRDGSQVLQVNVPDFALRRAVV